MTTILTGPCRDGACENGGTCYLSDEEENGFVCACPDGYYGVHCQIGLSQEENSFSMGVSYVFNPNLDGVLNFASIKDFLAAAL